AEEDGDVKLAGCRILSHLLESVGLSGPSAVTRVGDGGHGLVSPLCGSCLMACCAGADAPA
ncbi:MAG TPA: hypothetical protein VFB04_09715, partial [Terriglobales bacterium]|nr:hypothetical protein [Terriglobales bacterium]